MAQRLPCTVRRSTAVCAELTAPSRPACSHDQSLGSSQALRLDLDQVGPWQRL